MNINANPTHRAQIGYQGFDMSKTTKFTSSVSQILPVYYDILSPGDKVSGSHQLKTRLMPLASGAFTSVEEHVDYFFVPMEQIYSVFSEFFYGVQDMRSSNFDPQNTQPLLPYWNMLTLKQALNTGVPGYFAGYSGNMGAIRLLDMLGFDVRSMIGYMFFNGTNPPPTFAFSPLFLCAYQKIYYDHYRLSEREDNLSYAYNLDMWYDTPQISYNEFMMMCRLHYIPRQKDYYTNTYVSPLFGSGSANSLPNTGYDYAAVNQWLTSLNSVDLVDSSSNVTNQRPTTIGLDNLAPQAASPKSALNVANIRSMFAVDKLLEITRRAGKHYDKQTLAHFGVDVPKGLSGECFYIDGSQSRIDIGDVIATANSTDTINGVSSALGQVGGKGFGEQGLNNPSCYIDFTAPSHGIFMAIYWSRVINDYDITGVDKLNTKINREDFVIPEYDNLGMQPIFKYESDFSDANNFSTILGWQYRYSEFKQKANTIHGAFNKNSTLNFWTTHVKKPSDSLLRSYLSSPYDLDDVVIVNFFDNWDISSDVDKTYNEIYTYDPMLHEIYFDLKKASKMSTYGLPSL